jgi:hypothetical protein
MDESSGRLPTPIGELLDRPNERNGWARRALRRADMARQSVSKHLAVLETAISSTTVVAARSSTLAAPIEEIGERWITHYERERVRALADLKHALEEDPMEAPTFVYTTYIRTTPERLWQALTEPAFTAR